MISLLPILSLAAFAAAAPAIQKRADASPTLFTFTYDGQLVTATWYGTSTAADPPCPTQTFTYDGVGITIPYTGPGTPQSCLTPAGGELAPETTSDAVPESTAAASTAVAIPATTGPGDGGPSVPTSGLVAPTAVTSSENAQIPVATSAAAASPAASSNAVPKGFNYGSQGATYDSFRTQFQVARNLQGTSGFNSARLYTMIQDGTTNSPIGAIQAAIDTNTTLLLGLFYPNIDNELSALSQAIANYGTAFTNLVLAISVGSEDLYRNSPTGIAAKSNPGANPSDIISFIQATRSVIANTALAGKPVGHVDTWTAWVNGSNANVIANADFIGMNAFPYFQDTQANDISNGLSLFQAAYQATVNVAGGKPVWITETGWPVSGPTYGQATTGVANAQSYWDAVGCGFAFDAIPTFWYDLVDAGASPSFGVTSGGTTPLYNLACSRG